MYTKNIKRLCSNFARKLLKRFREESNPFERFKPDDLYSNYNHRELNIDPRNYPDVKKFLLTDSEISDKQIITHCQKLQSIDEVPEEDIRGSIFYLFFKFDSDAIYHLRKIIKFSGRIFPPLIFGKTHYRFINRAAHSVISRSWDNSERLSHLVMNVHENICEAIELTKLLEGDYVEIGVYLGGSAFTALNYMTAIGVNRRSWLLDTYDGFNYAQARSSSDAIWKDTHQLFGPDETIERISNIMAETKQDFRMIRSNICEQSLPSDITKIAVANIDVDLYDATKVALEKVAPLIVLGGIIICEDPVSTPGLYGACVAMRDFLEETEDGLKFLAVFKGGQYFLIKVKE